MSTQSRDDHFGVVDQGRNACKDADLPARALNRYKAALPGLAEPPDTRSRTVLDLDDSSDREGKLNGSHEDVLRYTESPIDREDG